MRWSKWSAGREGKEDLGLKDGVDVPKMVLVFENDPEHDSKSEMS
jgi:hypothetical protein